MRTAAIAVIATLSVACAREDTESPTVKSLLTAVDSSVHWSVDSVVIGDIDCDGSPDTAVLGRGRDDVRVGIVFGAAKPPHITNIPLGIEVQDRLPSRNVQLAEEDLDYDPAEEEGPGPLEGFRRSATCIGLNLSDGETDSMHMFWNHKEQLLDWWRR